MHFGAIVVTGDPFERNQSAAYPTYYLMVDNYYRGKLCKADTWYWDSIKYPGIKEQLVAAIEGR